MKIIDNKALLLNLKTADKARTIVETIPKSRHVEGEGNQILVNWSHEECLVLRNFKIRNVPSPILKDYEWPGFSKPFDHQRKTASFLTLNKRAFCLSEQGTGKTPSAIWASDYLLEKEIIKRVLVICPLSIMQAAWQNDLFKFAMHRSVGIAHGDKKKRIDVIKSPVQYVIINFDGVQIVKDEIEKGGFDLIIIDEATALKNANTDRWKVINKLVKPDTWLWAMTGTPAAQSPVDAYGLGKLVCPDRVPKYAGAWKDMVMQRITQFKWIPKPSANDIVFKTLQPAIRYTKAQCLDLPDILYSSRFVPLTKMQEKYYDTLRKQMTMQAAGEQVTAVNAAVNLNKLLQISCLAYNTEVLTDVGWVEIRNVTSDMRVWDGEEWVQQDGALWKGVQPTIIRAGVSMTSDHLVLSTQGWKPAKELKNGDASQGFDWEKVRLPDSFETSRNIRRESEESNVAMSLRMWGRDYPGESVSKIKTSSVSETLRMSAHEPDARDDKQSPIQDMVQHVSALFKSPRQGLGKIRRSWDHSMRNVARIIRGFLGRYERNLCRVFDARQTGQQRPVQSGELSLDYPHGTGEQHEIQRLVRHTQRENDRSASCRSLWVEERNPAGTARTLRMEFGKSVDNFAHAEKIPVYDLMNCGPRNRFVVRGREGEFLIVHNCGAVYSDDGEVVEFDCTDRLNVLKEVIDESSHKVLIFVPFRHAIEFLQKELSAAGYTCDIIHGGVSSTKRNEVFKRFQEQDDPRVLIIQPQAAAHGVTLHAANTVVWWGPITSFETYAQANARVHRAGQKNPCLVVHLEGSPAERKLYAALSSKEDNHFDLMELYKSEVG